MGSSNRLTQLSRGGHFKSLQIGNRKSDEAADGQQNGNWWIYGNI